MKSNLVGLAALAVAACAGSVFATAVEIPMSAKVAGLPTQSGDGLNGKAWHFTGNDLFWADMRMMDTPDDTYMVANKLKFRTAGAAYTPAGFLGNNGVMHSNPNWANSQLADWKLYKWTGYIKIDNPGQYDFGVISDDGFRLKVGGQTISQFDGNRSAARTDGWANFSMAGLYEIEVLYWNASGDARFDLLWNYANNSALTPGDAGPSVADGGTSYYKYVPQSHLFKTPVPTPGAAALLGLGGLVASRRRR